MVPVGVALPFPHVGCRNSGGRPRKTIGETSRMSSNLPRASSTMPGVLGWRIRPRSAQLRTGRSRSRSWDDRWRGIKFSRIRISSSLSGSPAFKPTLSPTRWEITSVLHAAISWPLFGSARIPTRCVLILISPSTEKSSRWPMFLRLWACARVMSSPLICSVFWRSPLSCWPVSRAVPCIRWSSRVIRRLTRVLTARSRRSSTPLAGHGLTVRSSR